MVLVLVHVLVFALALTFVLVFVINFANLSLCLLVFVCKMNTGTHIVEAGFDAATSQLEAVRLVEIHKTACARGVGRWHGYSCRLGLGLRVG